ncbi:hypothetical protein [Gudongella sp. SC589]|jgi:site-specific recombinase XerD|uniref:hypothetical protein n=1 Tax=Gudongella sp. SC589 TaxID=3385990 RepID=UPI003904AC23
MNFDEHKMIHNDYEQKCNEIRKTNEFYLEEFIKDLQDKGLKEKTINRHFSNVDFYINTYLLREEPLEMISGTDSFYIKDYLGYFFIRKCMWSTPSTIRSNAASIKKFYDSMFKRGHIEKSNYTELMETIKDNMESWVEDCEAYNDPDLPNPFSFF